MKCKQINEIKDNCIYIIDTNCLLLPYGVSSKNLEILLSVYKKIISENRLLIPAHVIREFIKNRPKKIQEFHDSLTKMKSINFQKTLEENPLLKSMSAYPKIIEAEKALREAIKGYQNSIEALLKSVEEWIWNDPISEGYASTIKLESIYNVEIDLEEIKNELKWRNSHKIPPGFDDASKDENAEGDLLLWYYILHIGINKKKDVIFVTNETKKDWWFQSNKVLISPCFELMEEFFRKTEGKTFQMMKFADFLELNGVEEKVITAVKEAQLTLEAPEETTGQRIPITEENILKQIPERLGVRMSYIIKKLNIKEITDARIVELKLKKLLEQGIVIRNTLDGKSFYKKALKNTLDDLK